MTRDHAAFLRGITNVSMQPLRASLVRLGLRSVTSFGASGNLLFCAHGIDPESLEDLIGEAVGAVAIVRSHEELSTIVGHDPYAGRVGAAVFLAKQPFDRPHVESLCLDGFEGEVPVIEGSTIYFVHPTRRPGRKGIVDFERELNVRGTMRSSKVLARVLDSM